MGYDLESQEFFRGVGVDAKTLASKFDAIPRDTVVGQYGRHVTAKGTKQRTVKDGIRTWNVADADLME